MNFHFTSAGERERERERFFTYYPKELAGGLSSSPHDQ